MRLQFVCYNQKTAAWLTIKTNFTTINMKTYKNSDVSKIFGVAPSTVTLWVKNAMEGKNNLQLVQHKDKFRLARSQHNDDLIVSLKNEGNKYKPHTVVKKIVPKDGFYKVFNTNEVIDIITSLEVNAEIPHKYTYFSTGAQEWFNYVERSFSEPLVNTVTNTVELLNYAYNYLDSIKKEDSKVNIIDIGVGDSRPVKEFVEKFVDQNILEGYIGLDISKEMLKKSETNMKEWFGEKLKTEYYLKDINKDYFADIIFKKSNIRDKEIQNLVLFVETTIENQIDFNKTLVNIKDSLGKDDLALIMFSLDTLESRSYYDYWSKSNTETMKIPNQIKWIPDLLNLTEDNYTSNSDYDSAKGLRVASIRLNTDIDLEFNFSEGNLYKKIHLPKNTDIRLWQHSHHKISSLLTKLNNLGLDLQFLANSKNQAQAILLLKKSGIKEIHNSIDTLNYD